jgi:DNA-binding response OmpR family regulator
MSLTSEAPTPIKPQSMPKDRVHALVVDDDAALLRLLSLSLRQSGFEVTTAVNGQEALDRLAQGRPDVIVLDLEMPVMDGRQFYREMRATGDGTPVLILSAFDARNAKNELGAEAYLNKPFDPDELAAMLLTLTVP